MESTYHLDRASELAMTISENTKIISHYLASRNLPELSLDETAPPELPVDDVDLKIVRARTAVIDATEELHALMKGPKELLRVDVSANVGLHAVVRYNIAKAVPVGGQISFAELSQAVGLEEAKLRRLLRHAMVGRVFREPIKGFVAHTALSRLLAEDSQLYYGVLNDLDTIWPASTRVVDAIDKWPNSEERRETGFVLANDDEKSIYEVLAQDSRKAANFARGIGGRITNKAYSPQILLDTYDWQQLHGKLVVDVGGSHGLVARHVAKTNPETRWIVQDLAETVQEGRKNLPPELADRVEFMEHNFFKPQPVKADMFFLRSIFHNWPDAQSTQILRNLVPGLKEGSRIVVQELVLPEPNSVRRLEERRLRNMDITMMQLHNAHERDEEEWQSLFSNADSRFHYLGYRTPDGAAFSTIEAVWKP